MEMIKSRARTCAVQILTLREVVVGLNDGECLIYGSCLLGSWARALARLPNAALRLSSGYGRASGST